MKLIRANILGLLFYISIVLGLFIIVPPWILFCIIFKRRNTVMLIAKPFFNVIFFLFGIKIKIEGEIPAQSRKSFLLSNHQSFIDIPVLMCKLFPCAFLAKKSLFKIPYFGTVLAYTNSIPVERSNPQANINLSKQIRRRFSNNYPIAVFPEGTRSKNGEYLPFRNGIFRIIKNINSDVYIFPVTIIGAHKVLPKTGIALYPGEIKIILHKIIDSEEISKLSFEELKDKVQKEICLQSNEIKL